MGYTPSRKNHGRKVLTTSKKKRHTTNKLHVNANGSKKSKSSNIDYVKRSIISNFSTLEDVSSPNTLISLTKIIDPDPSVCIID